MSALATRYRPLFFRDVIGQDIFVTLLRHALERRQVPAAILLTGIRGTGKTTLARLVAKALLCDNPQDGYEPCNQCPQCNACHTGSHPDVWEVDAASHTSIEDMKPLLESVNYQPLQGRFRLIIFDEAHMLSKSAFNAFLKTLEEPPSHVRFILATTEAERIPDTILSRCHHFPLHRIGAHIIASFLTKVCTQEGFPVAPDALSMIAQHGGGSVRDALSLLERVLLAVPLSSDLLTRTQVETLIGIPSALRMEALFEAIKRQEASAVLSQARSLYTQGIDPVHILKGLMTFIHGLVQEKVEAKEMNGLDRLDLWWQVAQRGQREIREEPFPLPALEMVLLRLTYMARFPTPTEIVSSSDQESTAPASPVTVPPPKEEKMPAPSFATLLKALEQSREGLLHAQLICHGAFVSWEQDILSLHWHDQEQRQPPLELTRQLEKFLAQWTHRSVQVIWVTESEALPSRVQEQRDQEGLMKAVWDHPLGQKVKEFFPEAILEEVKLLGLQ